MGMSGISFGELMVVLVIALLVFGSNRLRNLGGDLGEAIKGFRNAMNDGAKAKPEAETNEHKPAAGNSPGTHT